MLSIPAVERDAVIVTDLTQGAASTKPAISLNVVQFARDSGRASESLIRHTGGDYANVPFTRAQRLLDIGLALTAILFFAPLMIFITLAISVCDPGPVVFRHERLGWRGSTFRCLKFRTMRVGAAAVLEALLQSDGAARAEWATTHKLRNDPRVSALGRFLRKTSLDELPQLFNVLKGDMSIVGPRPIVVAEAERYGKYISAYYGVKPGITGVWQVSGRNHTTYRRRVACDVCYARAKSVYTDLAIIACTIPAVLFGRGAY